MLWVPFSGKDSMRKASRNALLLSMVLVVLAYGVLLGSFGRKAMNEIGDPIIEIMSSVQRKSPRYRWIMVILGIS